MKHSTKSATKQKANSKVNLRFEAIGTVWSIDLLAPADQAQTLSKLITTRITEFNKTYSRFRSDSWVNSIRRPGSYAVPHDFKPLFEFYQQLNTVTGGAVTPLIGDVMERAGYDATYSLEPRQLKPVPALSEALVLDGNTLHVKYSCVLDVGAAGKGYLVDILGELLVSQGITNYTIDAGGDILHHSPDASGTPLEVGLEDPADTSKAVGKVTIHNRALCGSASNRRAWSDTHHIINPLTLTPVQDVRATWVIATNTMLADGLATALFFVGPEKLADFNFEYAILKTVKAGTQIAVSEHFSGEIFEETTNRKVFYEANSNDH